MSAKQECFRSAWKMILTLPRDEGELVNQPPIEIVKNHFITNGYWADSTCYQMAAELIRLLVAGAYIIPTEKAGAVGRGSYSRFSIVKNEELVFPENNDHIKKGTNAQLEPSEFEKLRIEIESLKQTINTNCGKPMIRKEPLVMLWVDGPNFGIALEEADILLSTAISILVEQAKKYGSILNSFVFQNPGCPHDILKTFKQSRMTIITCLRAKGGEWEQGHDPVDNEMSIMLPKMCFIADIHLVVSQDKDLLFSPIEDIYQQSGKRAIRIYVDESRRLLRMEEKGQDDKAVELPKRSIAKMIDDFQRIERRRLQPQRS